MLESDKNILKVIDFLKDSGKISFKTEAYEVINISRQNLWKIKNPDKLPKQKHHFTAEQIIIFCKHFNINANYIFGFESNVYRK
jgi:hypothetical protein